MRAYQSFLLFAASVGAFAQSGDPNQFFESRVRPILAQNCFACHTNTKLGGLRVDSRQELLQGGARGPAIVPGEPEQSLLIRAIEHKDPKLKMPMGGKLADREIADLIAWVKMGAPWPESTTGVSAAQGFVLTPERRAYWAFQPVSNPGPPAVKNTGWARNAIDAFILSKLEEQRLTPAPDASKRQLIRRATYDLHGLPPTPEEIAAFLSDSSPAAFRKVVDRLLASPRYGERWGRHWLDVARYTDQEIRVRMDYANAWRYRDWVVEALNSDMPYDQFVKAQIAADLLPGDKNPQALRALGFISLGHWNYQGDIPYVVRRADELDDRVDVLTRGFLGLTVACAHCHDHKYDPISQKDYYALAGVFASTDYKQYFLVADDVVAKHREHQQKIRNKEAESQRVLTEAGRQLEAKLAAQTARYLMAVWKLRHDPKLELAKVATEEGLDRESLQRWALYLAEKEREHTYLERWDELVGKGGTPRDAEIAAEEFQKTVLAVIAEKDALDKTNRATQERPERDPKIARTFKPDGRIHYDTCTYCEASRKTLERNKYYLIGDLFSRETGLTQLVKKPAGAFEFKGKALLRFLNDEQRSRYDLLESELQTLNASSPPDPPYIMGMAESATPANAKIHIRGNVYNVGEEVPRGFPAILGQTDGKPLPFRTGSGRLELAEAIVRQPLTPRVMVNRIWAQHFGRGIVATPSNFGQSAERPTHPKLLDYLASRFVGSGWSVKAIHREIMLSRTYQLSSQFSEANNEMDAENRFFWRANTLRLDAEALRDSLLYVAGGLDLTTGGPSFPFGLENRRRSLYGKVSREETDAVMNLFDFPDPTLTSEQRPRTTVPLQGLFFLNSDLVLRAAGLLADRLRAEGGDDDTSRIRHAYSLLYGRQATAEEIKLGLEFLKPGGTGSKWQRYAQVLLASGEFYVIE